MDCFYTDADGQTKLDSDPTKGSGSEALRYIPLTDAVYTQFSSRSEIWLIL